MARFMQKVTAMLMHVEWGLTFHVTSPFPRNPARAISVATVLGSSTRRNRLGAGVGTLSKNNGKARMGIGHAPRATP